MCVKDGGSDQQGGIWERYAYEAGFSQEGSIRWRILWWKAFIAGHMK
jgi:hypothetical protein